MQPTTPTPMVIQRREVKYRMTQAQKAILLETMAGHMEPDSYSRSEIRSLYFDTPDFLLARRSREKPFFKEKLRLRSYGPAATVLKGHRREAETPPAAAPEKTHNPNTKGSTPELWGCCLKSRLSFVRAN